MADWARAHAYCHEMSFNDAEEGGRAFPRSNNSTFTSPVIHAGGMGWITQTELMSPLGEISSLCRGLSRT